MVSTGTGKVGYNNFKVSYTLFRTIYSQLCHSVDYANQRITIAYTAVCAEATCTKPGIASGCTIV